MRLEGAVPPEILAAIRAPFLAEGARPLDAPVIQPLGLFLDLAGEALRERLFIVQAAGGEEACLRPDFTVAVARQHLERGAAAGRYAYEGPAFRSAPDGDRLWRDSRRGMPSACRASTRCSRRRPRC